MTYIESIDTMVYMVTKLQFDTLGLKEEDFAIFEALENTSLSVSDIARAIKIPRTSLVRPLKRLHNRKIIRKYTLGRKVMWKAIPELELLEKIHSLFPQSLDTVHKDNKTVVLNSQQDLVTTYEQMLKLPTKYPIYAIQSNESMASMIKHYPSKKLEALNTGIKNKRLIVHAILEEDVVERFGGLVEKHSHSKPAIYKSVHGRSAITRYVPKKTFTSPAEI